MGKIHITSPFLHTSTFGGNPLAYDMTIATIGVLQEEQLVMRAAETGLYF